VKGQNNFSASAPLKINVKWCVKVCSPFSLIFARVIGGSLFPPVAEKVKIPRLHAAHHLTMTQKLQTLHKRGQVLLTNKNKVIHFLERKKASNSTIKIFPPELRDKLIKICTNNYLKNTTKYETFVKNNSLKFKLK